MSQILSLALNKPGPTRSPKAIQPSNASPNLLDTFPSGFGHSSPPIIIDLLQSTLQKPVVTTTTAEPFTWKPVTLVTSTTSSKSTESTTSTPTSTTSKPSTTSQVTWKPFPTHPPTTKPTEIITTTTTITTTSLKPVTSRKPVTAKPKPKPRPTEAPSLGFGASLLQAIFGRNIFASTTTTTTQRPVNTRKPVQTTNKVETSTRPVRTTPKTISITTASNELPAASQHVENVNSLARDNNKKATSTFSPKEDAEFLLRLLNAADKNGINIGFN